MERVRHNIRSSSHVAKTPASENPVVNLYLHYSSHHTGTFALWLLHEYIVESGGIARESAEVLADTGRSVYHSRDRVRDKKEEKWIGRGPSWGAEGVVR